MEYDPEREQPRDGLTKQRVSSKTNRKRDRRPKPIASDGPVFQKLRYPEVGSRCSVTSNTQEETNEVNNFR